MELFTRRHGLDQPEYDLRYEYLPPAFRLDVYKAVKAECESSVQEYCIYRDASVSINKENARFYTTDEIETYYNPDFFIELILEVKWHEVLSLIEHFVTDGILSKDDINQLFDFHKVGYQYDEWLEQIVIQYDAVIEDVDFVLEADIQYDGVIESVKAAKKAISDPEDIRLAHAVKNSVDALEGYIKEWLSERNHRVNNLGSAIKIIRKEEFAPKHIIDAIELFYIFRHTTENAGHGDAQIADLTKAGALLCLEMAVSLINYFYREDQINTE